MSAIWGTSADASAQDPANFAAAITPSDSADLTNVTTAVYIGGTGTLTVTMVGERETSTTVEFQGIPAGAVLPIRVSRIWNTGTSATHIVALWR